LARKDWFYIPLPLEQAKLLDEILNTKECEKYGIVDRTELIRLIIGEFLTQYEKRFDKKDLIKALRETFAATNADKEFIKNHKY
jgi:hypothetical protein